MSADALNIWRRLVRKLSGAVWAPEDEAAWLMQARTGSSPFACPLRPVLPEDQVVLLQWAEARRRGIPLGYLTGRAFFWGRAVEVLPGVFIPRVESEVLVEAVLEEAGETVHRVVDLGTGSGALLLAFLVERPRAWGVGVDRSRRALQIARWNAERWGVAHRTLWIQGDGGRLPLRPGTVDVVLANPPYVPEGEPLRDPALKAEPPEALFSPDGGVAHFRAWMDAALILLRKGGVGVMEASSVVRPRLDAWMRTRGIPYRWIRDASGEDRGILFWRPGQDSNLQPTG